MDSSKDNSQNPYKGINIEAYIATIAALLISVSGQVIPALQMISNLSWLIGAALAFGIYLMLKKGKN
jgi:allantoin permease